MTPRLEELFAESEREWAELERHQRRQRVNRSREIVRIIANLPYAVVIIIAVVWLLG